MSSVWSRLVRDLTGSSGAARPGGPYGLGSFRVARVAGAPRGRQVGLGCEPLNFRHQNHGISR